MKGVVDLNKYKAMKDKKEKKNKPNPNTELLKELISKPVKELKDNQFEAYAQIGIVFATIFRDKHRIVVVEFRGEFYVLNNLGNGTFEYLGTFNEILDQFV